MTLNLKPAHSDDVPFTYGSAGKGDGTPVSGTIQVTAEWVAGTPAMPPPPQVTVKLTAGAQAGVINDSPQTDDGFQDTPNTTAYNPFYTVSASNGVHLITKKTNGSSTVEIGTYSLSANSSRGLPGGNYWVGLRADQDDRSVTITRQGAHDEIVAPDGTIHGDTTFSHYESFSSQQGLPPYYNEVKNWQQFNASLSGSWHSKQEYQTGFAYPIVSPDVSYK